MFEAVILAAGFSSRAGSNKMEFLVGEKTILQHTIEAFYTSCHRITIVGGFYFDEIKKITNQYQKVTLIKNENYEKGMFSSILRGIEKVKGPCFICPGDYPLITTDVVERLSKHSGSFVVPSYKGKRGHPVLLNYETILRLKTESPNSNLKKFRDSCEIEDVTIENIGVLIDVDTLDDYKLVKDIKEGVAKIEIT